MEYPKTYEYIYDRLCNLTIRHHFNNFSPDEKREMTCLLLSEMNNEVSINDLLTVDKTLLSYLVKLMKEPHLKDTKNVIQKKIWETNAYKLGDELYLQFFIKVKDILEEVYEEAVTNYKIFNSKVKLLENPRKFQIFDEHKVVDDHERAIDMNQSRRIFYDTHKN